MKSIYLKGNSTSDALALATILSQSQEKFKVVRKSFATEVLRGLQNITIDFSNNNDIEDYVLIDTFNSDKWEYKCDYIANLLKLATPISYEPYNGFVMPNETIEQILSSDEYILFRLYPHQDQNLDLMIVDMLSKLFLDKGVATISGGSEFLPYIKGTLDLRNLIGVNEIVALKEKFKFLLTSEIDDISLGEALSIPTFLISATDKLTLNGVELSDSYQIYNYINRILTSK